ncbi:hypothetical protein GCM10022286_28680 [Gryllotalpicola daejeonensis]|uniref:Glycerophosphoryl diester phosphodiesterase membrane domain-containing protein n=1 Tax=Gryllotalpicola daejeonensis TaxID=993087 RepID=A0ABP7ZN72_9MICO
MSDQTAWRPPQYGAAPAWSPPPKPGLIPLRPLTFGQLLGTPFQVLRRNTGALFGAAILIQVIVLLGSLLIVGGATAWLIYRTAQASDADRDAVMAGGIAAVILAALITVALSVLAGGVLQGIVVIDVANGVLGHKPRAAQLWHATRGRRWALAGFIVLVGLALLVGLAVLGGIVAAIVIPGATQGGGGGGALIAVGVLVGLVGGAGFAVLWAWLWGKTSLAASAIMLERLGIRAAIARSWRLSRGGFWRVFGSQILVIMICAVATQIVSTPISFVFEFAFSAAFPTGTPSSLTGVDTASLVIAAVSYGALMLFSLVVGAITNVIQSATGAVVYIDQRMRREGLDLVLTRFVEDRQAGRPLGDPFATPQFTTPPFAAPPQYGPPQPPYPPQAW